jgi:hypothetical protein
MPTDGVYLVNCTLGNEQRSGLAYYSTIITNGGNDGHQPDAFAYVKEGGFIHWEGSEQCTYYSRYIIPVRPRPSRYTRPPHFQSKSPNSSMISPASTSHPTPSPDPSCVPSND